MGNGLIFGRGLRGALYLSALAVAAAAGLCSATAHADPLDPVGGNTIAVWRPSNGTWFVLNRVTGATRSQQWGTEGDIPVPADYDGDGTTDFAVWRPSTGQWWVINSSNGQGWVLEWGIAGDVPVPGHYLNHNAVDIAIWRPSDGTWWLLDTTTGASYVRQWGTAGDVPVPGSYHVPPPPPPPAFLRYPTPAFAVWRASSGMFFVNDVDSAATSSRRWGEIGDIPVPGDYNSDGVTDFAIWRPSDGMWWIIQSNFWTAPDGGTVKTAQWGEATDIPVPNDYDGDGKTDVAVWRPSTGNWHIIKSSDGNVITQQWGTSGDVPVRFYVAPPPIE